MRKVICGLIICLFGIMQFSLAKVNGRPKEQALEWSKAKISNSDMKLSLPFLDQAYTFKTPPDSLKPWVNMWWYDKITTENITQHLEELKSKGVGGVVLIDLVAMPKAPFLSDAWRVLYKHTVKESGRLGLKLGVNVCEGWPSGGSWITPENSTWMTISSSIVVKGPQKFASKLPEPFGKGSLYKDVVVQAFPVASTTALVPKPIISLNGNSEQLPGLLDGNYNTGWKTDKIVTPSILIDFGAPKEVDWIWLEVAGTSTLESSVDGKNFTKVWSGYTMPWNNVLYEAVPKTKARWFRINVPEKSFVRDFSLGTKNEVARFVGLATKIGLANPYGVLATTQIDQLNFVYQELKTLPTDAPLDYQKSINLTAKCSPDGTLTWDVPPGSWKIVRLGQTTTGIPCFVGLLTDYMGKGAMDQNFDKLKILVDDAGPLAGKVLQYFVEDNVEIEGLYSWTPKMLDEFRTRRGYDATPYLAALAGEVVGTVELTDRFLADVRRTIADCVADNHYGYWAELSREKGIKVRAEAGGQHHPRIMCNDGLLNLGKMDVPVAEFWANNFWRENQFDPQNHHTVEKAGWEEGAQNVNAKQAASAAHLYGKKLVGTEAFTSLGGRSHWGVAPGELLLNANIAFCEGLNSFSIHGSATSGPEDGKPGKAFIAGTHFNHNVTWWNMAAEPFLSYLTRCQFMLQQGLFVADVLYYTGDEVPCYVLPKNIDPNRGFGFDYDVCNLDILLNRLSVKNGMIVLPDGMNYRMLVLSERTVMSLPAIRKIEELVLAGATILGPKPLRTNSLMGYPQSEAQLKSIADRLWIEKKVGLGRVISDLSIKEVLTRDGIVPDFFYKSDHENDLFDFIHKRDGEKEIYFIINRRDKTTHADFKFRVKGKQPELWNPLTGETRIAGSFTENNEITTLPLELTPYGSVFVVFNKTDQKSIIHNAESNYLNYNQLLKLEGSWKVSFDTLWGGPKSVVFDSLMSWTVRPEENIKYFSGEASYNKTFDLPANLDKSKRISVDLGVVKNVAEVWVNGKKLGVVWTEPFRIDITDAVKLKANHLEVKIVNLWNNRLIGDAQLPKEKRMTKSNVDISPKGKLYDAGLLGPVRIMIAQ
jgi:hypothetical protein